MPRPRSNSVDKAKKYILKKIESFELGSGDTVSDLDISKEIGMSRTPVREAIMQLINSNLLERNRSKVIVKSITISDVKEILQLREAIETISAKCIIEKGGLTPKEKEQLDELIEKLNDGVKNQKYETNFENDALFHTKIIQLSGNQRMIEICDKINMQSRRLRWITILTPQRYIDTSKEHQQILSCIESMDITATQNAISTHIQKTYENYENILNDNQWNKILLALKNLK